MPAHDTEPVAEGGLELGPVDRSVALDERYEPGSSGCPRPSTDNPYARTSIRLNGKTKKVSHYYGCGNSEVLHSLTALERKIDEIAGTENWIK